MRPFLQILAAVTILAASGCSAPAPNIAVVTSPTLSSSFDSFQSTRVATITPLPTPTFPPTQPADALEPQVVTIYDDRFRRGWDASSPDQEDMQIDPRSSAVVHSGSYAISVTPQTDRSKLFIAVGQGAGETYPRDDVLGVSLWLYSGSRPLLLSDLALTAIGSNTLTYFDPADDSVTSQSPYEETFLNYLGFNDDIPAETWVEITIWLNEMVYDPDYEYLTGLYITNQRGFTRTFAIDDVTLIMAEPAASAAP